MKIFKYIKQLDCFIVNPSYKKIADRLGLTEWNEIVWIGRYFTLDNDYGEHWFDNWEHREKIENKARKLGYDAENLLIIDSVRFKNDKDGPCHSNSERKQFWTDVLKSLDLSLETFFFEARKKNGKRRKDDIYFITGLDSRIKSIKKQKIK